MRDTLEMADHRVYTTDDNWATVKFKGRTLSKSEADHVRFIVIARSRGSADD